MQSPPIWLETIRQLNKDVDIGCQEHVKQFGKLQTPSKSKSNTESKKKIDDHKSDLSKFQKELDLQFGNEDYIKDKRGTNVPNYSFVTSVRK